MTIETFFDDYLTSHVNLNKICDECTGSEVGCDICLVKGTYKQLLVELQEKLKIQPTDDEKNKPSYFLTGSYRRHTMIRPPKDVDIFIVLDSGEYQDTELNELITPSSLISKVKSTLQDIYSDQENVVVKKQTHSVTVIFNESFSIDVIPAFETDDGKAYMIPNIEEGKAARYIVSNPQLHYKYINDVTKSTRVNGKKRFKKIVRLLKWVKSQRLNQKPIKVRSFHFELLAAKILEGDTIDSYAVGIRDFFSEAGTFFDKASLPDPANNENMIDDYVDDLDENSKIKLKAELSDLYKISDRAIAFEREDDIESAIAEWQKIFNLGSNNSDNSKSSSMSTYIGKSPSKPWCND